jgi:hypothetical protein
MRHSPTLLSVLIAVLAIAACRKTENAVPAPGTAVATPLQQTLVFKPYTDTFYGPAYLGDAVLPTNYDTLAYIYAYHPTPDSVRFTTDQSKGLTYGTQIMYWSMGLTQDFPVNDSNYYGRNNFPDMFTKFYFRVVKDSLYYYGALDDPSSLDTYITYFTGKKTNRAMSR